MVLVTVVMSNLLIQTLGQASRGVIHPADVFEILGFSALGYSATLLTLSLFLSVIATLSRMYRDSEMVIWFSAGQSLTSLLLPIFKFAWPILICIFFSALTVWPWSHQKIQEIKLEFQSKNDIDMIVPGKFQEIANNKGVFFINTNSQSNVAGSDVFLSRVDGERSVVMVAKQGNITKKGDEKFLVLLNGEEVSTNADTQDTRLVTFKNYEILVKDSKSLVALDPPPYTRNSWELIKISSPILLGELSWRVSQGLCAINLIFFAIALSTVNPRAAKSYQMMKAILVFTIYYNLVNYGQRLVSGGSMSLLMMLGGFHSIAFLLAVGWIKIQQSNVTLKNWLKLPWPKTI